MKRNKYSMYWDSKMNISSALSVSNASKAKVEGFDIYSYEDLENWWNQFYSQALEIEEKIEGLESE